jgi:hypothetical protein
MDATRHGVLIGDSSFKLKFFKISEITDGQDVKKLTLLKIFMHESAAKAPTDTPITWRCLISPCCFSASARAEHTLLPTICESKLALKKFPRHFSQSYTSTYLFIPVK